MALTPTVATVMVSDAGGAQEPSDAKRGAGQAEAMGAGERARQRRWQPVAVVAPPPAWARCSCCGRIGEVVDFDGRPAIMRGPDPR